MASLPPAIDRVLRGGAREGAAVLKAEVKLRAGAEETRDAIVSRAKRDGNRVVVRVSVKRGWGLTLGIWQEWGTFPHFISVDASQRQGRSVGRVNRQLRDSDGRASLVIGGAFVGTTVLHPGARAEPFMSVALDLKGRDAIAAAQTYIVTQLRRHGVNAPEPEGDDA